MKYEKYTVRSSNSFLQYDFVSLGPKGHVMKRVDYTEYLDDPGVYDLSFGDVRNGEIDDTAITDNGDGRKVLATVCFTILAFLDKYRAACVLLSGNTPARTRLYRMAIGLNFEALRYQLEVLGRQGDEWKIFEKGLDYEAFKIKRKHFNVHKNENTTIHNSPTPGNFQN